ncbi:hypothetical protein LCGC14_2148250 [marine sediment metagenome]|uniref:Uncharacterized protein n=1 Tax=marine sediment metagenome TaxID=412755 RepID=A0A0F9EIG9_9ZZZZ
MTDYCLILTQAQRCARGMWPSMLNEGERIMPETKVGPPWDEEACFTGKVKWLRKKITEPIKPKPAAIILKMWAEQLDNPDPEVKHIAARLHDLANSLEEWLKKANEQTHEV